VLLAAAASAGRSRKLVASLGSDFEEEEKRRLEEEEARKRARLEALGREVVAESLYLDQGTDFELAAEFQRRLDSMGGAQVVKFKTSGAASWVGEALREVRKGTLKAREAGGGAVDEARTLVDSGLTSDQKLIGQIVLINAVTLVLFVLIFR
jgi:hypothetical protein